MNKLLNRDPELASKSTERRIHAAARNVLKHLLMCDEFPLADRITGTSDFAKEFVTRGPRDSQHRSLRDLDLQARLFKYPCSYLIYSPAFTALPIEVRKPVIEGLLDVLEGRDDSQEFAHLSAETRATILNILQETRPEIFQKPE